MNKRALVMRRKTIRAISMALLLVGVLAVEALTMNQIYRGVSSVSLQQEVPIDPGQLFQSW